MRGRALGVTQRRRRDAHADTFWTHCLLLLRQRATRLLCSVLEASQDDVDSPIACAELLLARLIAAASTYLGPETSLEGLETEFGRSGDRVWNGPETED